MNNTAYSAVDYQRLPRDLTPQQKEDIEEAFRILEVSGASTITPDDLKVALRALGYEPDRDVVRKLVSEMDKGGVSSNLVLSEFADIMRQKFLADDNDAELDLAFPLFTEGKSEFITLDDLRRVAVEVGEDIPEEVLQEILREGDVLDRDSQLSFEEFKKLLSTAK